MYLTKGSNKKADRLACFDKVIGLKGFFIII